MTDAAPLPPQSKDKYLAYFVCWLLGLGSLVTWNSMLTVEDYYVKVFPWVFLELQGIGRQILQKWKEWKNLRLETGLEYAPLTSAKHGLGPVTPDGGTSMCWSMIIPSETCTQWEAVQNDHQPCSILLSKALDWFFSEHGRNSHCENIMTCS